MVDLHKPEDVAANNARSLNTLERAIAFSQGEFSLVLVRCNYADLRSQMLQRLRERAPVAFPSQIKELVLPHTVQTLYTTLHAHLGHEPPAALMVLGLESVIALDDILTSTNLVRDEFRKRLPFPLVLWVNDEVLHKLLRFAPDFASWAATPIKFEISTDELINFLGQKADSLFAAVLSVDAYRDKNANVDTHNPAFNLTIGSRHRLELDCALKDLQLSGQILEPELEASLNFVLGLDDYANDKIDSALNRYQESLNFWQQGQIPNYLERQGILLFHIGLCCCRNADRHRAESHRYWEEARHYFQQCTDVFEEAERFDLVAQFISQLGEVLEHLERWEDLQILAQKSLQLHQTYGTRVQLAQDYGFLAYVALKNSRWADANQLADLALSILAEFLEDRTSNPGSHRLMLAQLYRLLLVKSQRQLGYLSEANNNLEIASLELKKAIEKSDHRYDPQRYLRLLELVRSLYFEQGRYLEAFKLKQEQSSIEQQYGFRAFIGAGRLQPQRQATNPALIPVEPQGTVAREIATSGRQQDVNRLIERLSRSDRKLTVIHGPSGVGKSSIVQAGLVPALKQRNIGDRIALPLLLQGYTDWVRDLGKDLAEQLKETQDLTLLHPLNSPAAIIEQLRQNEERNLLTVLIFDQFEEFFFVSPDIPKRRTFYDFLQACLNTSFVKVIFSLREDYLHYLLECEKYNNLETIDNNILDRQIRYYLGNFSSEDTKSVIKNLTERSQFHLEDALINELVRDLAADQGEVRPIELQVVGAQLQAENITTLQKYRQFGPKEKLVERFLEKAIEDCGTENERTARLVLYLLTDENNTRPLKTRAELTADLAGLDANKLDLVLDILVGSGLVFLWPEVPAKRYQLVHDYLVPFIRQQEQLTIRAELEELRKRDKLSKAAIEQLNQEKQLLAQLADAEEKQKKSEARLNRVLKSALAGSVVALGALGMLAFSAVRSAQRAEIAETNLKSEAFLLSKVELGALVSSVRAGKKLHEVGGDPDIKIQTVGILQKAVYGVQESNRLEGHSDWVSSVTFSPDGSTIASASRDTTVNLWRRDGSLITTLKGHTAGVYKVAFSPDGQIIATASADKTVKFWKPDGTLLQTLSGHSDRVSSLSFSADGQTIATASDDKTVKLWKPDGTLIQTLPKQNDIILDVSFSPDGQTIATARGDSTVKLWKRDGTLIATLSGHEDAVTSVSFSPDGQTIASASADNTIKLWMRNGVLRRTLKGHSDIVFGVTFSPDGQTLASASEDSTVKLWRRDGVLIRTLPGHNGKVLGVSFSAQGDKLASASADGTVKIWSLNSMSPNALKGHSKELWGVTFSPDGQTLASASDDKTVKLWKRDGKLLSTLQGHSDGVNWVSFSPDGQTIASASSDKTVKLWNRDGRELKTLKGHSDAVNSISFSPDGQTIASASDDKTVKLWKPDGSLVRTLQGHDGSVNWVSFSPDGSTIATASDDATVGLWQPDGKAIATLQRHTGPVKWVSFSPDGQIIATASDDATVRLWKRDGTWLRNLKGHADTVYGVNFSPDGKTLVSASADKTLKLWSVDGTFLTTLEGHTDEVYSVSFSPDGKMLASASQDKTIILWNLDLDDLLVRGCDWLRDYLKNKPQEDSDRTLCYGIATRR